MSEIPATSFPSQLAFLEAEALRQPEASLVRLDQTTGRCTAVHAGSEEAFDAPQQLMPRQLSGFLYPGELRTELSLSSGFNLHWATQPASGKIEGRFGLLVEPHWAATARLTLAGPFFCAIWRDDDERVRVRLKPIRPGRTNFLQDLSVESGPARQQAQAELMAALRDTHPLRAFEALLEKAGRGRAGESVTPLLDFWREADPGAAAALWRALDRAERLAELRDWLIRIAEAASHAEFAEDLAWAPLQAGRPAEAWIEALAGTVLDGASEASKFERLREAARAAGRVLGDPALLEILQDLKRRAAEQAAAVAEPAQGAHVRELTDRLQGSVPAALRNKLVAELSARAQAGSPQAAWLDASFDFSAESLRTWRELWRGRVRLECAQTSGGPRLYAAVLTHGLRRQNFLQVRMPFLQRKPWEDRLEALAGARVETTPDGRLLVHAPQAQDDAAARELARDAMNLCGALAARPAGPDPRFDLSWSGAWRLSPVQARSSLAPLLAAYRFDAALAWLDGVVAEAEQIEAEMSLSVPGATAAVWLEAPVERSPNYKEAYAEMSVTVQQTLRMWLPFAYFRDLARYDTLSTACPLIVYRCTLPFRSKAKTEFTYDIMSAESVAVARRSTGMALAAELARIEQLLLAAGKAEQARLYRPSRREALLAGVERAPRLFHSLLVADAVLIDHLIRFGVQAGGLRRALEHEPQRAVRELVKCGEELVTTFNRRLRRLYGGEDFTALGSLILVEATRGLNAGLRGQATLNGILRLAARRRDGREVQAWFVNADPGHAAAA